MVIGCVGSATYSLLPALARALREQLPGVDFAFQGEMLSPDQLDALRDGSIDLALLRPFRELSEDTGVAVQPLREEKYVVALPEGHRLASRSKVRVADLRDEDLIVHTGHGRSAMYDAVSALCRDAGFEPAIRHEVAETSTLVTFVAAALGVAIVPETGLRARRGRHRYRPLAGRARMELVAATRADDDSALLARTPQVLRGQVST